MVMIQIEFEVVQCANCGISIVATPDFFRRRRKDHEEFYCVSGHTNYYSAKTEEEKLREQLANKQTTITTLLADLEKAKKPKKRGRPRK